MKKLLPLLICCALVFSCSKDDNGPGGAGNLTISGKVMSPNNAFPISKAKIKVFNGTQLLEQTVADALGNFSVTHLPEGNLTVKLSKGKFTREISVGLHADYVLQSTERTLDTFPHIAVVTGDYDKIEDILFNIGIVDPDTGAPAFDVINPNAGRPAPPSIRGEHRGETARSSSVPVNVGFGLGTLLHDPEMLASYDIIFFNCGGNEAFADDTVAMANLKTYIQNGGIVYATDWSFKYLKAMFPDGDYLTFATPEKSGNSVTANVVLGDEDLSTWLQGQGIVTEPSIQINGFLGAWQMVDSFNAANVNAWAVADAVTYSGNVFPNKPLSFTFAYGCGGVFYSSFHTHGNDSSEATIEQMMQYFIFELAAISPCTENN
jgi:hypothetical protein